MTSLPSTQESITPGQAISNAKKARLATSQNVQSISSRVALLKHEEAKLICKINEARKKAHELYKIKKNNEDWKKTKRGNKHKEEDIAHEAQHVSQKYREDHEKLLRSIRESIVNQRKKEADEIRKQKEIHDLKIKEQEKKLIEEKKKCSKGVKVQEDQGKQKITNFYNFKNEILKQEKMNKVLEEELTKKEKELLIKKLELEEMDLLKKLQYSKDVHKSISTEYEILRTHPIEEFEKQFPKGKQGGSLVDFKKELESVSKVVEKKIESMEGKAGEK